MLTEATGGMHSDVVILCSFPVMAITNPEKLFVLADGGSEWYICEGFQLVLKKQVEALEALGVCPQMKVCESSTDVDSDPERPSLLRLLSLSESEGDLQTDCSFVSSVSKASVNTVIFSTVNSFMQSARTVAGVIPHQAHPADDQIYLNQLSSRSKVRFPKQDELHNWTCRVVKKIGIGEVDFLTLMPGNKSTRKVKYDVLAAAVIVVVLKLLFLLDDHYEWLLSELAEERNKNNTEGAPYFEFKKWYEVVKHSLDVKQKKLDEERAKYQWRCEKPLFYSVKKKSKVLKRRHCVVIWLITEKWSFPRVTILY
ncbi:hypothetical protein DUI87_05857 [Hirundo rustica rustica]|uniref:Rrn7/TAF1B C-terminal cyclin domain-containing protein n=1 Tax=Hirundo rustica rustica TaxID=333673 RepID=A0A3M0KVN5_HIRRU|nr:hypothetical protein DUI87_05857 [Hirundo rustica rustica]